VRQARLSIAPRAEWHACRSAAPVAALERRMPRADAVVLPIAQASAELLARHLCVEVLEQLGGSATLWSKGAAALTVGVVETPHQEARYTVPLAPRD